MNDFIAGGGRIGIIIVLVGAAYLAYRWWKNFESTRGSLTFDLPHRRYQPNGTVEGSINVQADKKDLGPGRLIASLVCEELWQQRRSNDDGMDHWVEKKKELYRQDADLATELSLHAGNNQIFAFSLPIPAADFDTQPGSGVGRFIKSVGDMGKKNHRQVWLVEGRYDVRGLDLFERRHITIDFVPPPPPPPGAHPPAPPSTAVPPPPQAPPPPPPR